jgi:hypothetical protein
LVRDTPRSDA